MRRKRISLDVVFSHGGVDGERSGRRGGRKRRLLLEGNIIITIPKVGKLKGEVDRGSGRRWTREDG